MAEFTPLSLSHLFITAITVALIVFLPYFYINKADRSKNSLIVTLILLMLINHAMDFYYEGYLIDIKLVCLCIYVTSLQLQLCCIF